MLSADGNDLIVKLSKSKGTATLQGAGIYYERGLIKKSGKYLIFDAVNPIVNRSSKKKIVGTDGRDYIINTGNLVTLNGGNGNDTIEGADDMKEVYIFNGSSGEDVITNFGTEDTRSAPENASAMIMSLTSKPAMR